MTIANRSATLTRHPSTPDGTFGEYLSDHGFKCFTVEKPWMDNETDQSCIPRGKYLVLWQWSNKHGCNLYHLQEVPNRFAVEIHSANLAVQLQGCIAPGMAMAFFAANSISDGMPETDSRGVSSSVDALAALETDMRDSDGNQVAFYLTVE